MASKLEAFAAGVAGLQLTDDRLLVRRADELPISVRVADVRYVETQKRGVKVVLADGREYQTRSGDALPAFAARLDEHAGFVQTQNAKLVNLDQVQTIRRTGGRHELAFDDGTKTALTMNQDRVMAYLDVEDLDHVMPWSDRLAILVAEKLRTFEKDIRFMDVDELRSHFSTASTHEVVLRQVVANIVWQAYNWIKEGKLDPLDGNIRSFWYSHIKVVVGRIVPAKDSHYKMLTDVFTEFVGQHQLFRYKDFGLVDDTGATWRVGQQAPHIILCAEKKGHWKALQQLGNDTGVTVICLGGQPSLMTTEGLTDEMVRQNVDFTQRFHLVTDVDYDPSGNIIVDAFRNHLHWMGVKGEITRFDIIQPANFTPDEIKFFRYPVADDSNSDLKKTKKWMNGAISHFGGGLPGPDGIMVPDGLESDSLPRQRLREHAIKAIDELKKAPRDEAWAQIQARLEGARPVPHDLWGGRLSRFG